MKGTNAFFFFKTDIYSSSFSYSSSQITIAWLYRSIYVSHLENESTYRCQERLADIKTICTLPVSQFKQCIAMKTISGMFLYTVFFCVKNTNFISPQLIFPLYLAANMCHILFIWKSIYCITTHNVHYFYKK